VTLCPSCGRTTETAQVSTSAVGHLTVCTFCGSWRQDIDTPEERT